MRIVATAIVSHPLIVLMHMRGVRMAGLVPEIPVRSALIPASHIAAIVVATLVIAPVASSIVRASLIVGVRTASRALVGTVVPANVS
jgi:hypothetical protein